MYEPGRNNETQRQQRGAQQYGAPEVDQGERNSRSNGNGGHAAGNDHTLQRNADQAMNMAELAVRGTTMLFDIQMSALRSIWHVQARSAAAFGAPDYSDLLRYTENGAHRVLSTSAEQVLTSARQATDAITEVQSQFGRLIEQGAQQLTEEIRHGIEEVSQRTQESLQVVKQMAEQSLQQSNGRGASTHRDAHEAGQEQVSESQRDGQESEQQESAGGEQQPERERSARKRR